MSLIAFDMLLAYIFAAIAIPAAIIVLCVCIVRYFVLLFDDTFRRRPRRASIVDTKHVPPRFRRRLYY